MKFNSKRISGFLIFTSTIILAACGGEGSDQNTHDQAKNNLEKEDKIYQVYYQPSDISSGIYSDSFEITQYPIKNNEIFFSKSHNQPLKNDFLTEQKVLNKGTLQTNIVKRLTSSSWTYELTPDLKKNLKFEIVKLDGENIFDRVLPGYKENKNLETGLHNQLDKNLIDFYQNYKNVRFPKNSYCYRLKESQWNQSYISDISGFDSNPLFSEKKQKIIERYNNLGSDKKYFRLLNSQWYGYNLTVLENLETGDIQSALGNNNNQSASMDFVSSNLWNADKSLAYEKSHLYSIEDNSLNNVHSLIALRQKLKIANLEKGCFAFNTQAAQAIQRLNLVNWQPGDSSDIGPFFGRRTFAYDVNEAQ
ncbi:MULTISPECIES: hypothetical protein [Acinetobacter]|jgi:hypothetical protein|uniref:Lipoprotein n=1 Tax=Acinetobacter pittii TaxID=48296 RepID=A0A242U650_ACIPI|nr:MULTISPECIES: hypothetical protein [Acinetobacter]EXS21930.1 hypothetical protein J658_3191 [Acinetobacter baumannii 573719]MBJ8472016.1 hypothetical protein [Acinetobacter pittii]MBJ8501440.1 hypothetical protein [Acinetobacter pittii]MBJ9891655.1 hypothetical protein [Acinetobacter pittii]MCU4478151.1 hypothetical protein [Acinetobacter sp. WU_MDCI_Abxd143]